MEPAMVELLMPRRIEILSQQSTIAVPYRVPLWAYPHVGLLAFIAVAWIGDFLVRAWGWWR